MKTLLAERWRHPIKDNDNVVNVVANAPIANAVCLKSVTVTNSSDQTYGVSHLRFDCHGNRHRYNILPSICGDDPDLTEIVMVSFPGIVVTGKVTVVTGKVTVVLPKVVLVFADLVHRFACGHSEYNSQEYSTTKITTDNGLVQKATATNCLIEEDEAFFVPLGIYNL